MRIVVLGGGTGTFTVLSGLKHHPVELSAVVSIADNGGSTGILRDELGVLPPGDIRQCLVALAAGDDVLRRLFMYRFHEGSLSGHSFGNLFLSALEKISGDSLSAVREAHRILQVRGQVIPVSACSSNLFAELSDGSVIEGEEAIDDWPEVRAKIQRCFLSPAVSANPAAVAAIMAADAVVLGPGDLYTSLIPVLLADGIRQAMRATAAQRLFIVNLMTKRGQTDGFTARDYCQTLTSYMDGVVFHRVIINRSPIPDDMLERYHDAGEVVVKDDLDGLPGTVIQRAPLVAVGLQTATPGDTLRRSLLRHDPTKLAAAIMHGLD